jgi:Peptidase A4 family
MDDPIPRLPTGYETPTPPEQNPADWPECELKKYGLPIRPDKHREPGLYRLWVAAFGKTLRFIQFPHRPPFFSNYYPPPPSKRGGFSTSRFEKSLNWSGLYIEPSAGKTFVQVWGQWTVPTPKPPTISAKPGSYQCAIWIGLDGQRRYRNSSLPQIGTRQSVEVEAGQRELKCEFNAWVQWWHRTDCKQPGPVTIPDFPVGPGNVITCVLRARPEINESFGR